MFQCHCMYFCVCSFSLSYEGKQYFDVSILSESINIYMSNDYIVLLRYAVHMHHTMLNINNNVNGIINNVLPDTNIP